MKGHLLAAKDGFPRGADHLKFMHLNGHFSQSRGKRHLRIHFIIPMLCVSEKEIIKTYNQSSPLTDDTDISVFNTWYQFTRVVHNPDMCNLSAILHTIVVMITIQQKGMRIKNSYVSYVNTVKGIFLHFVMKANSYANSGSFGSISKSKKRLMFNSALLWEENTH